MATFTNAKTDKSSGYLINIESIAWISYEPVSGGQMRADVYFSEAGDSIQLFGENAEQLIAACRSLKAGVKKAKASIG